MASNTTQKNMIQAGYPDVTCDVCGETVPDEGSPGECMKCEVTICQNCGHWNDDDGEWRCDPCTDYRALYEAELENSKALNKLGVEKCRTQSP